MALMAQGVSGRAMCAIDGDVPYGGVPYRVCHTGGVPYSVHGTVGFEACHVCHTGGCAMQGTFHLVWIIPMCSTTNSEVRLGRFRSWASVEVFGQVSDVRL